MIKQNNRNEFEAETCEIKKIEQSKTKATKIT